MSMLYKKKYYKISFLKIINIFIHKICDFHDFIIIYQIINYKIIIFFNLYFFYQLILDQFLHKNILIFHQTLNFNAKNY
jgi:hypothetical protein